VLGAELATADDLAVDGEAEPPAAPVARVLGAELATADDLAVDGEAEPPAAPVSETVVDGLFEADATAMMTSAPNAMSAESALCRAGQDLRFCPVVVWGGMADCGHDGDWGASC
jgi:hypothetical protein